MVYATENCERSMPVLMNDNLRTRLKTVRLLQILHTPCPVLFCKSQLTPE